jgi:ankyrin repeat protein
MTDTYRTVSGLRHPPTCNSVSSKSFDTYSTMSLLLFALDGKIRFSNVLSFVGGEDLCNLLFVCKGLDTDLIHEKIVKEILSTIRKDADDEVKRILFEKYDNYNKPTVTRYFADEYGFVSEVDTGRYEYNYNYDFSEGDHEFCLSTDVYEEHMLIHLLFSCAKRNDARMLARVFKDKDVQQVERYSMLNYNGPADKNDNGFVSKMNDSVDDENSKGVTLLQYAAWKDSDQVVTCILEHRMEAVSLYGVWGMKSILFACLNLSIRSLRILLAHSPKAVEDVSDNCIGFQGWCPDKMGMRAIHAIFLGKQGAKNHDLVCECLEVLLAAHADVNARTGPLDLSPTTNNLDTGSISFDHRKGGRFAGFTALHLATITKNVRAVKMLVDAGAKQFRLEKENVISCICQESEHNRPCDCPEKKDVEPIHFDEFFDDEWVEVSDQESLSDVSTELADDEEFEQPASDEPIRDAASLQYATAPANTATMCSVSVPSRPDEKIEIDIDQDAGEEEDVKKRREEFRKREELRKKHMESHVPANHLLILDEDLYVIKRGVPMRRFAFPIYLALAAAAASTEDDSAWMEIAAYLRDHSTMVLTLPRQLSWLDEYMDDMHPKTSKTANDLSCGVPVVFADHTNFTSSCSFETSQDRPCDADSLGNSLAVTEEIVLDNATIKQLMHVEPVNGVVDWTGIVWSELLAEESVLPEGLSVDDLQDYVTEIIAVSPRCDLRGFVLTRRIHDTDAIDDLPVRFPWEVAALIGRTPELHAMFCPELTVDEVVYAAQYMRVRDSYFATFVAHHLTSLFEAFIWDLHDDVEHGILQFLVAMEAFPHLRTFLKEEKAGKISSEVFDQIDNTCRFRDRDNNDDIIQMIYKVMRELKLPDVPEQTTQHGHAYLAIGKWEEALACFAEHPCPWGEAEAHASLGDLDKARELYTAVVDLVKDEERKREEKRLAELYCRK